MGQNGRRSRCAESMWGMIERISALLFLMAVSLLALPWSPDAGARGGDTAPCPGPVVLTDGTSKYALGLHLEILEDSGGQLTIEQVTSPAYDARFAPTRRKHRTSAIPALPTGFAFGRE